MTDYVSVIDGIKQNNFIVVGRVGIDLQPQHEAADIETATDMTVSMGGSSANIAAGICKFGGKSALVTRVSDDAVGRYCVGQLDQYGVDTQYVTPIAGEYRNSLAVYENRLEGHQSVIYRNGAADFQMDGANIDAVDLSPYGALITAGTVFAAEPSRTATFHAFEKAKAAGIPIIFDVDYRPYSWPSPKVAEEVLSKAGALSDVIVGNDEEFGFMAGGIEKGLDKARELSKTSCAIVVYKKGPDGAITFANGEEIETGIYPVQALKPTGAGDSFMAGLMASIADGHSLQDSLMRGSACASIVVAKPGCAPAMPNKAQLEDFLASHAGPTFSPKTAQQ